jgi:hypothetical protein
MWNIRFAAASPFVARLVDVRALRRREEATGCLPDIDISYQGSVIGTATPSLEIRLR